MANSEDQQSSSKTSDVTASTFITATWQSANKRAPAPSEFIAKKGRYSALDTDNKEDEQDDQGSVTETPSVPKPPPIPPIFISEVTDISEMIKSVRQVLDYSEFSHKTYPNGEVRVKVITVDGYRVLTKHLDKLRIGYYTYQLKTDRAYRVVLRHLHHTFCTDSLKAAIEILGHKVRNISKVYNRTSKTPYPSLFYIDLEPARNNKDIFDVNVILNANVSFEPPNRSNDIPQCHKCQSYEHTKNYCRNPFRCVRCGENHDSKLCKKPKTAPATCANCKQNHTSNWKGCSVYQTLMTNKTNRLNANLQNNPVQHSPPPPPDINNINFPQIKRPQPNNIEHNPNSFVTAGPSYSQVTQNSSTPNGLEQLLIKQMEKMDRLLDMMCMLINKLIK